MPADVFAAMGALVRAEAARKLTSPAPPVNIAPSPLSDGSVHGPRPLPRAPRPAKAPSGWWRRVVVTRHPWCVTLCRHDPVGDGSPEPRL